jgi:hypothetical protein
LLFVEDQTVLYLVKTVPGNFSDGL